MSFIVLYNELRHPGQIFGAIFLSTQEAMGDVKGFLGSESLLHIIYGFPSDELWNREQQNDAQAKMCRRVQFVIL